MKIDEIKDPQIRALAWKYRKANKKKYLEYNTIGKGFSWEDTKEGDDFWSDVLDEKPV